MKQCKNMGNITARNEGNRLLKSFIICLNMLLLTIIGSSCSNKEMSKFALPDASGTPYDLYVVMPEELKTSVLADSLNEVFGHPMECTPNGDPYFRVRYLTPESFSSTFVRIVGNVVLVNIDPNNAGNPVIRCERDRYARNQVIVKMYAQSAESLASYIPSMQDELRDLFVKMEMTRRMKVLERDNSHKQMERLLAKQKVMMNVPFALKTSGAGAADSTFFWTTDNGIGGKESHIVVYSIPYTDQRVFSLEGAVAVRDSVMRANLIGETPDSYMTTNRKVVLPEYKALMIGGRYVGELRGMWRMENGLMAGPFVCHIRLDELNHRVVFAEGFVYAPNDSKRLLIRNLEAALYTLRLPSDNIIPEIEITLEEHKNNI